MRIDFDGVWVAQTRDRNEGAQLKELGWKWHAGDCDRRWCKPACPARGRTGWWTANASTARRIVGDGVHSSASIAALEASPSSAPEQPLVIGWTGAVFAATGPRRAIDALREQAKDTPHGGWKWHAGDCDGRWCKPACPAKGHTGWWAANVELIRPLRTHWAPSLVAEMERREQSRSLSRATDADGDLPCPPGKAYLPFQRAGIKYAASRTLSLIHI